MRACLPNIPSILWFSVKNLINQREVCNHVGFDSQQHILDRQTILPRKRRMGNVFFELTLDHEKGNC